MRFPYRPRALNRAYAWAMGYFWHPCPVCNRSFGGHEYGGSIDNPKGPPGSGLLICSRHRKAPHGAR